jgi:hypothetical protein
VEESRVREEESAKRVQLRFEEAKMREEESTKRGQLLFEEAKMREEECTKRESIRMELEKIKEQVRMKELEVEHTNRLLLLEQARYKRAVAERENLTL